MTLREFNRVVARAREAALAVEATLANRYGLALRAVGREAANELEARAVALVAAPIFLPPDEDEVVDSTELAAQVRRRTDRVREAAARELEESLRLAGVSFEVGGLYSADLLEQMGQRATFAADRELRKLYRAVIAEALEKGWSVPTTANELRQRVGDLSGARATALARTDLIGVANAGSNAAARQVLPVEETFKQWLATNDDRTRPAHREAHGQTVPLSQPYSVDSESLMYPGDPSGSDENVMQCRCTELYVDSLDGPPAIRASAYPAPETEEEAVMSQAVTETDTQEERAPVPWEAVLAVEGTQTEDGRLLERGSISWRDLPLTLMASLETAPGHDGARAAGRIDTIGRDGDRIVATGELTTEFGTGEIASALADRTVRGVSVDLAVLEWEYRDADTGEPVSLEQVFFDEDLEVVFVVLDGVILGATVVPMQAIEEAQIAVVASAGGLRMQVFVPFAEPAPALTASAAKLAPTAAPRAWFETTEFPGPTPLTVTDEGRIFGHIATWDTCHLGIPGVCTTAPRSRTGYAYFHVGEYLTDEGERVDVGKLMFATKHASIHLARMDAARHYDDTGMVGGYIRAHDGDYGIWVSGVVNPELPADRLSELTVNPPSGDWRKVNGSLELIAALSVPVPAFPVPRAEAGLVASADRVEVEALVASSGLIVPNSLVAAAMFEAGAAVPEETELVVLED